MSTVKPRAVGAAIVGRYGKVRGPKGNFWYGQVVDVDLSGQNVLWSHVNYRMVNRWYPLKDALLHPVDDEESP